MISISPTAQKQLEDFLKSHKVEPKVRIYNPATCGCGDGDGLALTLDEPNDRDHQTAVGGLLLFIAPDLADQVGRVTIDFKDDGRESGFVVATEKPLPMSAGSDCGSCSCCG